MTGEHISLHQRPAGAALCLLLQQRSAAIEDECRRFVAVGDAEALHDLRVALRRLHSLFVAFAPLITPSATLPDALRRLQKQTNSARDLEVSLALLHEHQLGLEWLQASWQESLEAEYRRLRTTLPQEWHKLTPALEQPHQLLTDAIPAQPLGTLAAELLEPVTQQLKRHRRKVCKHWRDKDAHRLRIDGKQLRYLLEPFAAELTPCQKAVSRLKRFQERLGDYHDLVVLRARLKPLLNDAVAVERRRLKQARRRLKRHQRTLRGDINKHYCDTKWKKQRQSLLAARAALANG